MLMLKYFAWVLLVSFFFTSLFWFTIPEKSPDIQYLSPVPAYLSLHENKQVTLLDLWLPKLEQSIASESDGPVLSAKSALMYDLTTNQVIFEKNPKERLPMASLTKIMTAIIALENKRHDDKYYVPQDAIVGEDSMGLTPGEVLSLKELLYGLLLNSGNDAAEVLARNFPTGREGFLEAMNDKAQAMGLKDTVFSNPSGLQGDGIQHTTAYDLLVMTRYALEHFPDFKEVAATYEHDIPATATHKEYYLTNETNLLSTYPGVKGVKTGYTPEAGLCLVTLLEYKDHDIVGILLSSENRRQEMKDLLDYSLKSLGISPPKHD